MDFRDVREVQVGGLTKAELLQKLVEQSVSLNAYARVLFGDADFITTAEPVVVRIAVVSLPEIGLPQGGVFADILAHAAHVGLLPCPLELAPHLRLQYLDQLEGPYLTVASRKLRPDPHVPNGLYLRRLADGLWLRGYEAGPEALFASDFTDFVFAYP